MFVASSSFLEILDGVQCRRKRRKGRRFGPLFAGGLVGAVACLSFLLGACQVNPQLQFLNSAVPEVAQRVRFLTKKGDPVLLSSNKNRPSLILAEVPVTLRLSDGTEITLTKLGVQEVDRDGQVFYLNIQTHPTVKAVISIQGEEKFHREDLTYHEKGPDRATDFSFNRFYLGEESADLTSLTFSVEGVGQGGFLTLEKWQPKTAGSDYYLTKKGQEPEGEWKSLLEEREEGDEYQFELARSLASYRLHVSLRDSLENLSKQFYYFYTTTDADRQSFLAEVEGEMAPLGRIVENGNKQFFVDSKGEPLEEEEIPSWPERLAYGSQVVFSTRFEGASLDFSSGYQTADSLFVAESAFGNMEPVSEKDGVKRMAAAFEPQRRTAYWLGLKYQISTGKQQVGFLVPVDPAPRVTKVELLSEERTKELLRAASPPQSSLDRGGMGSQLSVDITDCAEDGPDDCSGTAQVELKGEGIPKVGLRLYVRDPNDQELDISAELSPSRGAGFRGLYLAKEPGSDGSGDYLDLAVLSDGTGYLPLELTVTIKDPLAGKRQRLETVFEITITKGG